MNWTMYVQKKKINCTFSNMISANDFEICYMLDNSKLKLLIFYLLFFLSSFFSKS